MIGDVVDAVIALRWVLAALGGLLAIALAGAACDDQASRAPGGDLP